jgi:hypothetical protein
VACAAGRVLPCDKPASIVLLQWPRIQGEARVCYSVEQLTSVGGDAGLSRRKWLLVAGLAAIAVAGAAYQRSTEARGQDSSPGVTTGAEMNIPMGTDADGATIWGSRPSGIVGIKTEK